MTKKKEEFNFKRTLVTAALPYANGPIHIGHLAGVYIPADIYVRYQRLKEQEVLYICGSDEHGVPIAIRARQEGVSPQEVVDRYHSLNKAAFEDFGISFDIYSRTSSQTHKETATSFFRKLYEQGQFVEMESEQLYDPEAKQFLADRYVTGECPHCHSSGAYGDQCEACGSSLNATDLIQPHSAITGAIPVRKTTKHWYLPLDQYESWLKEWILEEHKEWRPNVYGQCKSWLDMGLQPRAVSRDLDWGVPVPVEGVQGKVMYVWFDAPIGYISATKELCPEAWEKWWKAPETRLLHFIGKDNIVFHCIVFPSMLKAEGSYILPDNVPANEFLNLEGDKISTSRNHAVWLHEYLADFPGKQDVLRYVLTANAPETKDNDFSWKDFKDRNNNELVAVLGNFVNRSLVLTQKYFNGLVPDVAALREEDQSALATVKDYKEKMGQYLSSLHFRDAQKEAMNIARLGNKYLAEQEPWKKWTEDKDRVKQILYVSLQLTAELCIALKPFLPFTAEKLRTMLQLPEAKVTWDAFGLGNLLSIGHKLGEVELLFAKLEDKDIQPQYDKLAAAKQPTKPSAEPLLEEPIAFEDFLKADLRVGTVLRCQSVPKTDKLLQFIIDDGFKERTIVSGIAEFYKPEDLVGKQVCFIANLPPRKIRGILSEGMILSALSTDGQLKLISPSAELPAGSKIS